MLIVFLLLAYGAPAALGLVALVTGLGVRVRERAFTAVAVPLALLAFVHVQVRLQDGSTDYARYLRAWLVVAALGLLASVVREVGARRERPGCRGLPARADDDL